MKISDTAFAQHLTKPPETMPEKGQKLLARLFSDIKSSPINGSFWSQGLAGEADFWFHFLHVGPCDELIEDYVPLLPVQPILKEIKATGQKISTFYLITSAYIKAEGTRKWLEKEAESIADEVHILDIRGFIEFISEQIDGDLRSKILEANQRFFEDYRERMDQLFYLPEVPFSASKKTAQREPMAFLDEAVKPQFAEMEELLSALREAGRYAAAQPEREKCFVVSEFGFGKTSLLLQYAKRLKTEKAMAVYIPLALLGRAAFNSSTMLFKGILELLTGQTLDDGDAFDSIQMRAFKKMIQIRSDIVLLFDGLDEHHIAYSRDGLDQIAGCLKGFKPACIFSVRKEFWDARSERLRDAFSSKRKPFVQLDLLEWTDSTILFFLEKYTRETEQTENQGLKNFMHLVKKGEYEAFFGDIPKRPLFLEMLARDVANGELERRNLAQLYEEYFKEKLWLGRQTFENKKTARPLPAEMGLEKLLEAMLRTMEKAAAEMLSNDETGQIEFLNQIAVSKIKDFWEAEGFADGIEIFLHSVLIPFGQPGLVGLKAKFAHKSFQEFFVARFLAKTLLDVEKSEPRDLDWLTRYGSTDGVPTFMIGIFETLDLAEKMAFRKGVFRLLEKNPVPFCVVERLKTHF